MSVHEKYYRYLDGEGSPEERAQVEAEIASSAELRAWIENTQKIEGRVRDACTQKIHEGHRASIWARFEAARATDGGPKAGESDPARVAAEDRQAPIHSIEDARPNQDQGQGPRKFGFDFDWRFAALPAAAVAAALVLMFNGFFDANQNLNTDQPWFRDSTVVDAVLVSEDEIRSRLEVDKDTLVYQQSIESALATERVFQCFFGRKLISQELRRDTCQKLLSGCSANPISIPPFPKDAVIDAFRVYEMELPSGIKLQVPHFLVTHNQRRLSVHLICGSQKELVEEELRRRNAKFEILDGQPTKLCDDYQGCCISLMPKGAHLLMVVSELPSEEQNNILKRF